MDKELCFCIEGKELYLEQILVEYMNVPIFFLCKESESKQYYIVLCVDIYELNYILVKIKIADVYKLLHGTIPMRNVFLSQNEYWKVFSGDKVELDIVTKHFITELDKTILPKEGACFEAKEIETKKYVQEFDKAYFADEHFSSSKIEVDLDEFSINDTYDELVEEEKFRNLGKYKIDSQIEKTNVVYNEAMENVRRAVVVLKKETSEKLKTSGDWYKFAA